MSTGTVVEKPVVKLTDEDRELRDAIEARVRPKFAGWMKVSEAVFAMPEAIDWVEVSTDFSLFSSRRLYRETHANFEDYLFERWGVSRSWGHQIVRAGKVIMALPEGSEKPKSIRAALALAKGTSASPATDEPPGLTRARANGHVPADAEVTEEKPEIDPGAEAVSEPPDETIEDWLATLPARAKLSDRCRRLFDMEALASAELIDARETYRQACRKVTEPLEKECRGVGPWLAKYHLHFKINGPSKWQACEDCGGTGFRSLGGETGQCGTCKTMGYHV